MEISRVLVNWSVGSNGVYTELTRLFSIYFYLFCCHGPRIERMKTSFLVAHCFHPFFVCYVLAQSQNNDRTNKREKKRETKTSEWSSANKSADDCSCIRFCCENCNCNTCFSSLSHAPSSAITSKTLPRRTYSILLFYFIGFCGRTFIAAYSNRNFASQQHDTRQIRRIICAKTKKYGTYTLSIVAVSDERRLYATYYLHRVPDLTAFETTKSNFKFLTERNRCSTAGHILNERNEIQLTPSPVQRAWFGILCFSLYHSRRAPKRLQNWPTEAADELLHLSVSNAIVTDCNYELNLHLDQCANWPNRLPEQHHFFSFPYTHSVGTCPFGGSAQQMAMRPIQHSEFRRLLSKRRAHTHTLHYFIRQQWQFEIIKLTRR